MHKIGRKLLVGFFFLDTAQIVLLGKIKHLHQNDTYSNSDNKGNTAQKFQKIQFFNKRKKLETSHAKHFS